MTATLSHQQPRFNLYTHIHKGLRAFMAQTLVDVGNTDILDSAALERIKVQVSALFQFCRGHLEHEDSCIHPALERAKTGSSQHCAGDHIEHVHSINRLELHVEHAYTLASLRAQDAAQHWLGFYLQLSQFVAENFEHMYREEVGQMAVLWANYSDQELIAIHQAILAEVSPEDMQLAFKWMIPSIAHGERVIMLKSMEAQMPAEVFAQKLSAAAELLNPVERNKLLQVFSSTSEAA